MILGLCAVLPLLACLLSMRRGGARQSLLLLVGGALASFACAAVALVCTPLGRVDHFGANLFVSDPSSRLFLSLIATVFLGIALYVWHRVATDPFVARGIRRFVQRGLCFFSLSVAATLSNHFIAMTTLLEFTTLAVTPMIFQSKGMASVKAAWKYFLFSSVGLGLVFLGFGLISAGSNVGGELSFYFQDFSPMEGGNGHAILAELGLALVVLGYGTKLGLAPMYAWLPETYDLAPPSVTALLSAVQFNVVILALFRIFQVFHPLESALVRYELLFMGVVSILISTLHIVVAQNFKKLIAYASINHVGVIALGLGIGKDAGYGVVLYAISNAIVKAVLFLTGGNIEARFQTKDTSELKGLIKTMPFSGITLMFGIFALLGFAPFGSFIGEVMIMKSMIDTRHYAIFAAFCVLTSIAFVAIGRSIFPMIWGEPKVDVTGMRESVFMLVPNLFFMGILVTLGIYIPARFDEMLILIGRSIGGQ